MVLKQGIKVRGIYHVAWRDYHVGIAHLLDNFHVLHKSGDVVVIHIVLHSVFREKDMEVAPFRVDVVVTAGSQVFYERTGFPADIYLNLVDSAVAHVRNREIDNPVSSQERKCADGAVGLQALYINTGT